MHKFIKILKKNKNIKVINNKLFFKSKLFQNNELLIKKNKNLIKNLESLNTIIKDIKSFIKSFTKKPYLLMTFNGVGYKVMNLKNGIRFDLGYSHIIELYMSKELYINIFKNQIIISTQNYNKVNNLCFYLKYIKNWDYYRGKGIYQLKNPIKIKLIKKK